MLFDSIWIWLCLNWRRESKQLPEEDILLLLEGFELVIDLFEGAYDHQDEIKIRQMLKAMMIYEDGEKRAQYFFAEWIQYLNEREKRKVIIDDV